MKRRRNLLALVLIAVAFGAVAGLIELSHGPRDLLVPTWAGIAIAIGLALTRERTRKEDQ
jgi:hypothetical protein